VPATPQATSAVPATHWPASLQQPLAQTWVHVTAAAGAPASVDADGAGPLTSGAVAVLTGVDVLAGGSTSTDASALTGPVSDSPASGSVAASTGSGPASSLGSAVASARPLSPSSTPGGAVAPAFPAESLATLGLRSTSPTSAPPSSKANSLSAGRAQPVPSASASRATPPRHRLTGRPALIDANVCEARAVTREGAERLACLLNGSCAWRSRRRARVAK
jgi:hypothetical protein